MKQILRYSLVAILAMVGLNVNAQEVTIDFSGSTDNWGIGTTKIVEEKSFTYGGYTIKLKGTDGNGYRWYDTGNILLGKEGATLEFPAFSFDVERIDIVGTSSASAAVKQNIFVGDEAVSTETTGAKDVTNKYVIAEGKQSAGTIYTLKVTSNHNTQITKILIYKKGAAPEPPTATVKYTKASSVEAGKKYMMVATKDSKLYAAKPVSSNYGYLQVAEVTDADGVIMMEDAKNAFTFITAEGGYKIMQSDGRYIYMDETHTSFQVADAPSEANIWTAVANTDGTFKITNVARSKYVQLDASYGTYGSYDAEKGSMPYLYLLDEATGINTIEADKAQNDVIYNLAGQKVDNSYKGLIIKNGKKMLQK